MIHRRTLVCCFAAILSVFVSHYSFSAEPNDRPLMRDFTGVNGHFTFKPELYGQVCRLARNYHNMDWDVRAPGDDPTFPLCVNQVNWKEHVYGKWTAKGFEVDLCAMFGRFGREGENFKELWKDREAWAYRYGFEMAQYFGPSGANNLCTSIEIGNEPGNEFDDALYQRLFTQMAKGVRDGDPNMKIVTCTAHVRESDKYSKDVRETFADSNIIPLYDVLNLHVYAQKPKDAAKHPWERSYPEDPNIDYLTVVDEAIAWRDANAPGKEIWITEFGWDACTGEAMKKRTGWFEKLNWTDVTDLQQAQYLVRSFFCFAERDVERAYIYFYDDNDEPSVHAAAGLTRGFQPKPSFWAVKQLYEILGDYRFNRTVKKVEGEEYVYEFKHESNDGRIVWVVWSPTGEDKKATTVLALPAKPDKIEEMAISDIPAPNIEYKISKPNRIEILRSESPTYILMQETTSGVQNVER